MEKKQKQKNVLEYLCPNSAVRVFTYIDIASICRAASSCKILYEFSQLKELWRELYYQRYNADPYGISEASQDESFWREVFVSAYLNPHDLWIRHWTCAYPQEPIPGRCCIPKSEHFVEQRESKRERVFDVTSSSLLKEKEEKLARYCPTCRYHPCLPHRREVLHLSIYGDKNGFQNHCNDSQREHFQFFTKSAAGKVFVEAERHAAAYMESVKTGVNSTCVERAIFLSTLVSASKACYKAREEFDLVESKELELSDTDCSPEKIEIEATHAFSSIGKCDVSQFHSSGLHFLSDALFMSCHTSSKNVQERKNLLFQDVYGIRKTPTGQTLSTFGPTHESADLTWHIAHMTNPDKDKCLSFRFMIQRRDFFGVSPSEGFLRPGESLKVCFYVRSHGALIALNNSNELRHEHPLPKIPYVCQYVTCPPIPCIPVGYDCMQSPRNVVEHIWSIADSCQIRTIYISSHINPTVSFFDFERFTCIPLENKMNEFKYGSCHRKFSDNGDDSSDKLARTHLEHAFNTDCSRCSRNWSVQCEYEGRLHFLETLACRILDIIQEKEFKHVRNEIARIQLALLRSKRGASRGSPNLITQLEFLRTLEYIHEHTQNLNNILRTYLNYNDQFHSKEKVHVEVKDMFGRLLKSECIEGKSRAVDEDLTRMNTLSFPDMKTFVSYRSYYQAQEFKGALNSLKGRPTADLFTLDKTYQDHIECKRLDIDKRIRLKSKKLRYRALEKPKALYLKVYPNDIDPCEFESIQSLFIRQGKMRSRHNESMIEDVGGPILNIPRRQRRVEVRDFFFIIRDFFHWTTHEGDIPFVDRQILFYFHWLSYAIWTIPLELSLLSRWIQATPAFPLEQYVILSTGLSRSKPSWFPQVSMCGWFILGFVIFSLPQALARGRRLSLTFEKRCVEEYISERRGFFNFIRKRISNDLRLFFPVWTYDMSSNEIQTYASARNNRNSRVRENVGYFEEYPFCPDLLHRKVVAAATSLILSFFASSIDLYSNLFVVYFSSFAFGICLTVEALEAGPSYRSLTFFELFKRQDLFTLMVACSFVGSIIGGTGGLVLVLEVLATTVVLLLTGGGIASVSLTEIFNCWLRLLSFQSVAVVGMFTSHFIVLGLVDRRWSHGLSQFLWTGVFIPVAIYYLYYIFGVHFETSNVVFVKYYSDSHVHHLQ